MERKREKLVAGELDAPPEDDAAKEAWIQEYARVLEDLKAKDPAEYEKVVKQLQQQVQMGGGLGGSTSSKGGSRIKLPGQNKVLGEDGVEVADEVEREEVIPEPGFVVKTRAPNALGVGVVSTSTSSTSTSSGSSEASAESKVFINVCTSDKLRKFRQVKKRLPDGSVQEGLNIPLSCGGRKLEKDKQGKSCVVFDIIVHPSVVSEALADKTGNFRHWVCNFVLQYIQQKHGVQVDYKYKLPKMKYKGDLSGGKKPTKQFIRKLGPTIEEVDTEEEAGGNTKTSNKLKKPKAAPKALEFAKYSVRCTYHDGRLPCTTAVSGTGGNADGTSSAVAAAGLFATYTDFLASGRGADVLDDLPSKIEVRVAFPRLPVNDRQKLRVDMSHELVVVAAPGYRRLELFLPLPVRKTGTAASFDGLASGGELVLVMDVDDHRVRSDLVPDPSDDSSRADEGSRPWLLADALAGLANESKKAGQDGGQTNAADSADGAASGTNAEEDTDEEEFPEDAFHKQDVLSMHYLAEKKKQQARMKEKQAEAAKERSEKIARAKAGDKRISLEGTDGGIITEIIGGDDDDDDNDMPSLPAGFHDDEAGGNDNDDDDDDDDDDADDASGSFLQASTQFELLD